MKVNPTVFCNSPWYELHIFWNGDYGFCCHQPEKPYEVVKDNPYNVTKMSIREWFDSQPMRDARKRMFESKRWSNCSMCWSEEDVGGNSRRHRSNQKSVIFTKNFNDSLQQSPGYGKFKHSFDDQGAYDGLPIDLHIDLGNYCNLACKMCWSGASSAIATQEKKWGILADDSHLGTSWCKDEKAWNRFLEELTSIKQLKNIHFMGGETVMQPHFEKMIDYLLENGRHDLNLSFVTNGTTFNDRLITKLKKFNRIGVEVSIETMAETNGYVRQGTDTRLVIENLEKYISHSNDSLSVTVRPAISALTIRDFYTLILYCMERKILMKGLVVSIPSHLHVSVLPREIRESYKKPYQIFLESFETVETDDLNRTDPNNYMMILAEYAQQALNLLDMESTADIKDMVELMSKWDKVYGYDARELYPELTEILDEHGYQS